MINTLVVIPTYNEIENIEGIIKATFQVSQHVEILVVDDNSPDNTAQKVISLQTEYPGRLFLEKRKEKLRELLEE